MSVAYMQVGQIIELDNTAYKLDRLIDNEWQIINDKTKRASQIAVDDFHQKYASGELRFTSPKLNYIPETLLKADGSRIVAHLDLFPESEKEEMKRKRLFLESYIKKFGDLRSQKTLKIGIIELWNPVWGEPPSPATAARWLKRYIESDRDIRSLGKGDFRKGNTTDRYTFEVTEICNRAIGKIFLTQERGSIDATLTEAKKLIREENNLLPFENKLTYPTKSYIKTLISHISSFDKDCKRIGATPTEHKYRNAVHGIVCCRPLERVEIDHSKLDIFVVDGATGLPLGRPWITVVIDVFTRAILGFSLSFDPPSHMTVARALKMALLPKVNLKERWPSINGNWSMFGRMEDAVVDNGLEFHGDSLEAACFQLGINLSFCPRKKSWWKGHVERVIGTLNRAVTDGMPGRTFSGIKEKGEYNPVATASIPLETMEEMIAKWIVDVYHETTHSTLGLRPRDAWQESINPEDIPMVPNAFELDAVMGIIAIRKFSHLGIEINRLRYNNDELGLLRQQFEGIKDVKVKWNPEDLGYIHVLPPSGQTIRVSIVTQQAEYATGLTLYQHTACKAYSKKYLEGRDDAEALSIAKSGLRELAEQGMCAVSKKTRVQNHRLMPQNTSEISKSLPSATKKIQTPLVLSTSKTPRPKFDAVFSNRNNNKD